MKKKLSVENSDAAGKMAECLKRFADSALRVCYFYLHDTAAAEEAVRAAFLQAYRNTHTHKGLNKGDSLKIWLAGIADETCRAMLLERGIEPPDREAGGQGLRYDDYWLSVLDRRYAAISMSEEAKERIAADLKNAPPPKAKRAQSKLVIRIIAICFAGLSALFLLIRLLSPPGEDTRGRRGTPALSKKDMALLPGDGMQVPDAGAFGIALPRGAQKIVYGDEGDGIDDNVPGPGQLNLSARVADALKKPENEGAAFYVKLEGYLDLTGGFTYEGKTMDEWRSLPELSEYNRRFEAWAAEYEKAYGGDPKVNEWAVFREYWLETESPEVIAATLAAEEKALSATNAFHAWLASPKYRQRRDALIRAEYERLNALGLHIRLLEGADGLYMTGLLTKEQVENFPCGDWGYTIRFGDMDAAE